MIDETAGAAGGDDDSGYALRVRDLSTTFYTDKGPLPVLRGITFDVRPGETLGIVGESGSGKSVTAMSIMRLLAGTTGRVDGGSVLFQGRDLLALSEEAMRAVRGNNIAMIFQEPMTSLNPVMRIGDQITEAILLHQNATPREARRKAVQALEEVNLPRAEAMLNEFPFQLSGGQRQRVMIAMALVCKPAVLIADEPTTALDVTIQAQILALMKRLQDEIGTAILFITHDLGVIAEIADRVIVMYCGRIVERAAVRDLFARPAHPYTQGLLASVPRMGVRARVLDSIPGSVPTWGEMPAGCRFEPRCAFASAACRAGEPPLARVSGDAAGAGGAAGGRAGGAAAGGEPGGAGTGDGAGADGAAAVDTPRYSACWRHAEDNRG